MELGKILIRRTAAGLTAILVVTVLASCEPAHTPAKAPPQTRSPQTATTPTAKPATTKTAAATPAAETTAPTAETAATAVAAKHMIAAQMVLTLVEPQSSGIGGGAFLMHYDAGTGAIDSYDGRETAPKSATPTMFLKADGTPKKFYEAVVGGS